MPATAETLLDGRVVPDLSHQDLSKTGSDLKTTHLLLRNKETYFAIKCPRKVYNGIAATVVQRYWQEAEQGVLFLDNSQVLQD